MVDALAEVLGCNPGYFLGYTNDWYENDSAVVKEDALVYDVDSDEVRRLTAQLLEIFQELSEADQQLVLQMADRLWRSQHVRIIGDEAD